MEPQYPLNLPIIRSHMLGKRLQLGRQRACEACLGADEWRRDVKAAGLHPRVNLGRPLPDFWGLVECRIARQSKEPVGTMHGLGLSFLRRDRCYFRYHDQLDLVPFLWRGFSITLTEECWQSGNVLKMKS